MDYEKKYKEALERAREYWETDNDNTLDIKAKGTMEYLFPELKESEDEEVRKALVDLVKCNERSGYTLLNNVSTSSMLAWLEKQGEQKYIDDLTQQEAMDIAVTKCFDEQQPFNYENANIQQKDFAPKVEPKFKVGDWIVSNEKLYVYQIEEINDFVAKVNENGVSFVVDVKCLNDAHLWTIQDAKDGDVLIDKSHVGECVFIFKEARSSDIKTEVSNPLAIIGYCGINHIGFTSQLSGLGFGDTANCIYYPATKEQRELLFSKMNEAGYEWDSEKKELKKSAEWGEEDERMLNHIIGYLHSGDDFQTGVDWLKSLKQRHAWKPSAEQLNNILDVLSFDNCTPKRRELLESLYNDLKKLREE